MTRASMSRNTPLAELTRTVLGEAMTMDDMLATFMPEELAPTPAHGVAARALWIGSIGYERHKHNADFARCLSAAGVEQLIDVRQLPISRRKGYAKTALGAAMDGVGIEYVHIRALGNPKPIRDLYKAGHVAEGRSRYERYLLDEQREALAELIPMLRSKRTALMCVEHDPATCHRTVIVDALRDEMGLAVEVAHLV